MWMLLLFAMTVISMLFTCDAFADKREKYGREETLNGFVQTVTKIKMLKSHFTLCFAINVNSAKLNYEQER